MTIQNMDAFYSSIQKRKKKIFFFLIYSLNGTRKLKKHIQQKTLRSSELTMGQNSKNSKFKKNTVITKTLYNNSLSHTIHNKMAVSKDSTEQFINSVKAILKEAKLKWTIQGRCSQYCKLYT